MKLIHIHQTYHSKVFADLQGFMSDYIWIYKKNFPLIQIRHPPRNVQEIQHNP